MSIRFSRGTRKRRTSSLAALLLVVALCAAACGQGASSSGSNKANSGGLEKESLNVGLSLKVLAFMPAYVARAKGFWKEEGLDVKLVEFKGDADAVQALAGGAVDLNVAALQGGINMIKGGQDVKVIWSGMNVADFSWFMLPKYNGWQDLKGKKFAVTSPGSLTELLLKAIAKKNGLDPERDLQIVKVGTTPNAFAALRSGSIDVAFLSPPTKYQAEDEGFKLLATQTKEIAADWPKEVVYTKSALVGKSPKTVTAFLRGMTKAITFAAANRDETVQILMKELQLSKQHAERAYDELIPGFVASGALPSDAAMKAFWDTAIATGDVTEPWKLDRWWDPRFVGKTS